MEQEKKSRLILLFVMTAALLLLAALYLFARPRLIQPKALNQSGLTAFSFERTYSDGSRLKFTLTASKDQVRAMLYDSAMGGKRELNVSAEALAELQTVIESSGLYLWDGFNEKWPLLGGKNELQVTAEYTNGLTVSAFGAGRLPDDADAVTAAVRHFFYMLFSNTQVS